VPVLPSAFDQSSTAAFLERHDEPIEIEIEDVGTLHNGVVGV
jgi:hypothetical protein